MGKELKRKRQQKGKTKLKQKTLFESNNRTDFTFKTRKVLVSEQLKQNHESQPLTCKKLNIKDLISRLKHHSVPPRIDALIGIKELLTNHFEETICFHLSTLIYDILKLLLDRENKIRKEALKVIKIILNKTKENHMTPHFQKIVSFLNCTMTHIDTSIQEDSLLFTDILLEELPNLMATNADKFLFNFLNMISNLNSDTDTKRNLTLNLSQKITNIQWRIQVLCRLHKLLEIMTLDKENIHASNNKFHINNIKFISVYRIIPDVDSDYMALLSETSFDERLNNMKNFIDKLLPLLFHSWIEVMEDLNADNHSAQESSLILNIILHILLFLWKYISKSEYETSKLSDWFKKKYEPQIRTNFIPMFPFKDKKQIVINSTTKSILDTFNINPEIHNRSSNLLLIYLYVTLQGTTQPDICENILKYLEDIMKYYSPDQKKINIYFIDCLKKILISDRMSSWSKRGINFESFITSLVNFYLKTRYDDLFYILCEVALERNSPVYSYSAFIKWFNFIPDYLCRSSLTLKAAKYINKLLCRNNQILLEILKENQQKIEERNSKELQDEDIKDMIDYCILSWLKR